MLAEVGVKMAIGDKAELVELELLSFKLVEMPDIPEIPECPPLPYDKSVGRCDDDMRVARVSCVSLYVSLLIPLYVIPYANPAGRIQLRLKTELQVGASGNKGRSTF